MNYTEMTYKEKRDYEATLTTAQRGKIRKMEKLFTEQNQPLGWAEHERAQEVRKESWVSLKCDERIKALEESKAPEIAELSAKIKELQIQLSEIREGLDKERSEINQEVYTACDNDPQVKAINAIRVKTKEQQRRKMNELVNGFRA
jgi:DNA integrity scanning protein DisA with diadenylate cyclase activity